jgi:hypothetical protein
MLVNFYEHKFRKEGKYKCSCGYKFKRTANNCWTENPFNKLWMEGKTEELDKLKNEELDKRLMTMNCPKCDSECENLNN